VSTYESGYFEGYRRLRGSILAIQRNLTFKVPAAYQNTAVFQIGLNKIPPKFNTLCEPFMGHLASLKGSLHDTFMGHSASKG